MAGDGGVAVLDEVQELGRLQKDADQVGVGRRRLAVALGPYTDL